MNLCPSEGNESLSVSTEEDRIGHGLSSPENYFRVVISRNSRDALIDAYAYVM